MKEDIYFARRERDIESQLGVKEINFISSEIKKYADMKKLSNLKILDAGCGTGTASIKIKESLNIKVDMTLADLSEYAIGVCKKRGLNAFVENIENTKFEDNEFDVLYGQQMLEHTNIKDTLRESYRISKVAIFTLPIGPTIETETLLSDYGFEKKDKKEKKFFHTKFVTEGDLIKLMKESPYEKYRIVKDIVKFIFQGLEHRSYMIILYKEKMRRLVK